MSSDLSFAKELFASGAYTCVLCKGDRTYTTEKRGILPLAEWVETGVPLGGFSAADKIVGRAAAFLYILLGVKEVHASVMSEEAMHLLSQNGIMATSDVNVTCIINRAGTGICPMEQAVLGIRKPEEALDAIRRTMERLQSEKNG